MIRDVALEPPASAKHTSTAACAGTRTPKSASRTTPLTLFDASIPEVSDSPPARRSFSPSTCSPCPSTHFATPEWASPGKSFKTYLDQLSDNLSGDEESTLRTIASGVASMASRKRSSTPRSSSLPLSSSTSASSSADFLESASLKKPKHSNNSKRHYNADTGSRMTFIEKKVLRIIEPGSVETTTTTMAAQLSATESAATPVKKNEYVSFPSLKDDVEEDTSLHGKEVL